MITILLLIVAWDLLAVILEGDVILQLAERCGMYFSGDTDTTSLLGYNGAAVILPTVTL